MTPEKLELARHLCLLLLAVVCVYTDLAKDRLYNAVTLTGVAAGLALALAFDAGSPGYAHVVQAVLSAALGGGILFLVYLARGLGAGDVKFMAAVGALAGQWRFTLIALVYTALVGAVIALGILLWRRRLLQGLRDGLKTLVTFRAPKDAPARLTLPYGVAIGIGTIWAWLERYAM